MSQRKEISTMFLQIPFIFFLRVLGYFSVDFGVFLVRLARARILAFSLGLLHLFY